MLIDPPRHVRSLPPRFGADAPARERSILVLDLETVPDLEGLARMYGLAPDDGAGAEARLNGKFAKLAFHRIVCVGALTARHAAGAWEVEAIEAPHCGVHSEAELIRDLDARIVGAGPQIVTFNGNAFDLPVLRYRALVNRVAMPGLARRAYFQRYFEAAFDLCDVLSNFQPGGRVSLDALCRALDVPGKPEGIDGSRVSEFLREGRIAEIAAYCRADITATYRLWLAFQHMRGTLGADAYHASEDNLAGFLAGEAPVPASGATGTACASPPRHAPVRSALTEPHPADAACRSMTRSGIPDRGSPVRHGIDEADGVRPSHRPVLPSDTGAASPAPRTEG